MMRVVRLDGAWMTALASILLVASCGHAESTETLDVTRTPDGVAELRSCVSPSAACSALMTVFESKLHSLSAERSHQMAADLVSALRRHDAPPLLAHAIGQCGRGHWVSCRALLWAIGRLYLDDESSFARASECALTQELAAATNELR